MKTRFDSVGMWWEDYEPPPKLARATSAQAVRNIEVPQTGWKRPEYFPDLRGAKAIAFDTETKDLEMETHGPGFVRGAAHIVGVSVAVDDGAWYFPCRHEYGAQANLNFEPEHVFAWLNDVFALEVPFVGANALYDLEALRAEGVRAPASVHDIQYAEPLLDENAYTYALEAIARKHLGTGKESNALYEWCAASFGGKANGDQRANIWRSPPTLAGPYAEADARLPLQILRKQLPLLHEQGLDEVYEMERGLIPLLLEMRYRGVPVDVRKAEETLAWLRAEAQRAQEHIPGIDVWANASIARAFDAAGLEYTRTEAGNPSFTRQWLEAESEHNELARAIMEVRLYEKAANPFVESYILGGHHLGRLHCQFNPLRNDLYGTVSGRFSSSLPNLQNIPSRHKVLGPLLRSLFVPEAGGRWRRYDYSQVEYRLLAHYAIGRKADDLRAKYNAQADIDYHEMTRALVEAYVGVDIGRKAAKNLNFGMVYGLGKDKLIRTLGVSEDVAVRLYEAYHNALPCVKETYNSANRLANRRGYIRTLLGRRRRYPDVETDKYGRPNRKGAHTALNGVLQGSAADIMKRAMVMIWRSGVCDVIGVPHLTVHDELDWSDMMTAACEEAFREVKNILETCVQLRVPLLAEEGTGANWGATM